MAQVKNEKEKSQITESQKSFGDRLKSLLAFIVSIIIYIIIIRLFSTFGVLTLQSVFENGAAKYDPVIMVVFSSTVASAMIFGFIAKVPVYTLIKKGLDRLHSMVSKENQRIKQKESRSSQAKTIKFGKKKKIKK